MHTITYYMDEHPLYAAADNRVMAVCYDLRHALMGDREIEFVSNGFEDDETMDDETADDETQGEMLHGTTNVFHIFQNKKINNNDDDGNGINNNNNTLPKIAGGKNVYLRIAVLWPEMLFVMIALNDFVKLYAQKIAKRNFDILFNKQNIWDESIAYTRVFQAEVVKCLKTLFAKPIFSRITNLIIRDYITVDKYITQYVDILNVDFLEINKEKRIASIPGIAKKLVIHNNEYKTLEAGILKSAKEFKCPTYDLNINGLEYPDEIEW
ncbi:MAG: hypothetical protein M1576_02080 [Deltaproteobacteria bacterium]|nr:hypothetical protein [Deltaproteobacteria bacterium]